MKIRDVLRRLRDDGWSVVRIRGSHRILEHYAKTGIVVVSGNESKDVATGTLRSIWRQAELEKEL